MPDGPPTPVMVELSTHQAEMIDRFRAEKGLPSREAALALLLDIAQEAVTSRGRRFWDRPVAEPNA